MNKSPFFFVASLAAILCSFDARASDRFCDKMAREYEVQSANCPSCFSYPNRKLHDIRRLVGWGRCGKNQDRGKFSASDKTCEAINLSGQVWMFYYNHGQTGPKIIGESDCQNIEWEQYRIEALCPLADATKKMIERYSGHDVVEDYRRKLLDQVHLNSQQTRKGKDYGHRIAMSIADECRNHFLHSVVSQFGKCQGIFLYKGIS